MLSDVLKLTKRIYRECLQEKMIPSSPIVLYDSYRALCAMISDIHLVSVHYLALRFDEPFLENSSHGKPIDKWRNVLNGDLDKLNETVKAYLLQLQGLSYYENEESKESDKRIFPMEKLFNDKLYYGSVKQSYNVGFVKLNGTEIQCQGLVTTYNLENYFIFKHANIDVSTYEKRLVLKQQLDEKIKLFKEYKSTLEHYLETHYSLKDLLIQSTSVDIFSQ